MATDERNFRSAYYEKVASRSVEEKKSLEIILKDKPLDRRKLQQYCLAFCVPIAYRNLLWKLLLGKLFTQRWPNCAGQFEFLFQMWCPCMLKHIRS